MTDEMRDFMTKEELTAIAERLHHRFRPNESQCYALLNYITSLEAQVKAAEDAPKMTDAAPPKGKQK